MEDFYNENIARRQSGTIDLLGIGCHCTGIPEIHRFIRQVIVAKEKALILNLNIHCITLALKFSWLKDFLNQSQLVFCDGDGVRWGARILGYEPPPKVAFTRWIGPLSEFCEDQGYKVYFLGAKPGIAQKAANNLKTKYPKLQVVGIQDGYFKKQGDENEKVIAEINQLHPDILIICFGMPMQEKWLYENWKKLSVHIFLPAGAVFDYAAGELGNAPAWMIDWHLEWLFRIYQEPRRLLGRYGTEIPYFFFCIFREKLKRLLFGTDSKKNRGDRL